MNILRNIIALTLIFLFAGCANYIISTQNLVSQLNKNQMNQKNFYLQRYASIPSNNLERIQCEDEDGNKVWLYLDQNSQLIIVKKSDGEKVKAYFDTVILQNDTLYGLRSRIVGGLKIIPVNDIEKK